MYELALFAGVGGGLLGGKLLGWKTVCAVEKEPYCREVLLRRQRDGLLSLFPIWDDVRTFDGKPWRGIVDIVTAGFPCQPFSNAGKRLGEKDERNLWPETLRILCEIRPKFALLENVPALITSKYFSRILGDLAEGGFDARWCVLPASWFVDQKDGSRAWILVSPMCERLEGLYQGRPKHLRSAKKALSRNKRKATPRVYRAGDGLADRVERIKAIGNGQVPPMVRAAWCLLKNPE